MEALVEQGRKLAAEKKALYTEYREAKKNMQEVTTAKANIDYLLGYTGQEKTKEQERLRMDDKERSNATTSGQVGPKYTGLGLAPTSRFFMFGPEGKA